MTQIDKNRIIQNASYITPCLHDVISILQEFDITSIGYSRFYSDKSLRICSNLEWLSYFINNDILYTNEQRYIDELSCVTDRKHYLILREQDKASKNIVPIMQKYNQDNICSLYVKNDNYVEMFGFASDVGKASLSNFYANNIDFLLKSTLLLKEKLGNTINNELQNLYMPFNLYKQDTSGVDTYQNRQIMQQKIKLKSVYLSDDFTITGREFECLCYLGKGYTYREIAIKLGISARTVETHINHIKHKAGFNYKQILTNISLYSQTMP
jgi:DNA-binding CsgD family transcriptional regulator